ncbi:hypothetical protein Lalb_Chr24g0396791 [Lupinus albus]|uniref:Uncharacterized protein n=1 Tax=Lupinus albus TaxID=3870 RepID=A0A6A4NER1_LUPAL|nr:hypothetical protein Lalb_Chr24g0396791 [Lupinus albus]
MEHYSSIFWSMFNRVRPPEFWGLYPCPVCLCRIASSLHVQYFDSEIKLEWMTILSVKQPSSKFNLSGFLICVSSHQSWPFIVSSGKFGWLFIWNCCICYCIV